MGCCFNGVLHGRGGVRAPDTGKHPAKPAYHRLTFPEKSGHNTKAYFRCFRLYIHIAGVRLRLRIEPVTLLCVVLGGTSLVLSGIRPF